MQTDDGSQRHHYVPEYFIEGFTNGKGMLHVYDKKKDEFQKTRPPKSLFFERNANTAYWGSIRNTIAEQDFSRLDDQVAPRIKSLRTKDRSKLTESDMAFLAYHMATQYLRCPSNVDLYRTAYEKLLASNPSIKVMPRDETLMKSSRAFLPNYIVSRSMDLIPGPYPMSVLEHSEGYLVLTDNPVVYAPAPKLLSGLFANNMLAVSSRRLVINGTIETLGSGIDQLQGYNVLAIDQADRLVCASNEQALINAVNRWKWIAKLDHLPPAEALHRIIQDALQPHS